MKLIDYLKVCFVEFLIVVVISDISIIFLIKTFIINLSSERSMDPIAKEYVKDHYDALGKARLSVHVLILGPYRPDEQKQHLLCLKKKLNDIDIPASLLEDHSEGDEFENYRTKFNIACGSFQDSKVTPIICSYLPINASSGPLSEVTNIVDDPKKYSLRAQLRVFIQKGANPPDHVKSIPTLWKVEDGNEFVEEAFELVLREVQNIADKFMEGSQ